ARQCRRGAAAGVGPDLGVGDRARGVGGGVNGVGPLPKRPPALGVIVRSAPDEPPAISQALGAGAAGFVLKRTAAADLTAAVDAVLPGETYVPPAFGRQPKADRGE